MAKTITEKQKLEAFALYTMATNHYAKAREFERGVSEILGPTDGQNEYNDFVSDGIYGEDPRRPLAFDKVLEQAGITVKTVKKAKRR